MIVLACGCRREYRTQQILRTHPLDLRRDFPAVGESQQRQRSCCVPAPPCCEHRRLENGLNQNLAHSVGVQEPEYGIQRKAVTLPKRDHDAFVGRRSLQLEIECRAKPLSKGKSPGFVDPTAEWRVQHKLHPTAFVEEAFGNDGFLRGHSAQDRTAFSYISRSLLGSAPVESAIGLQPRDSFLMAQLADFLAHTANVGG